MLEDENMRLMTPSELADEMEAAIERVEYLTAYWTSTIEAIASGADDPMDGIRFGEALLDLRQLARDVVARLSPSTISEPNASLTSAGFRGQLARLEIEASEQLYRVAMGDPQNPPEREPVNAAIVAVALWRSELRNLRRIASQA